MKEPTGSSSRWDSRNEDYGNQGYGNRDYGRGDDRYPGSRNDQDLKRNGGQGPSQSQRNDYNGFNGKGSQQRTHSSRYYNDSRKRSRDDLSYDRTVDEPKGRDDRRGWEMKREKREPNSYSTEKRYGYQDQPTYNNWNPHQFRRTFPKKKSDYDQGNNHWQQHHDAESFDEGIVHGPMKEGYGSTPPSSPTRRNAMASTESRKTKSESPVPLFGNDSIDFWPKGFAPGKMPEYAYRKTKSTSPVKKYEGKTFVLGANRQVKGGGIAIQYLPAPITASSSLTAHTATALRGNKRVKSWNTIAAHYHQATGRAHNASLPLLVDKQGGYHLAEELWVRLD
ncbi:hypothetical protein PRIPAC_74181 [Pristionchus pacificus]|uniref:Uncharacterized protein n=1 Tax=Pristionchus pacificus TaxID=54126 RepID=A0A2A6C0U3_PRIPA|nr:hypothetical protein PRIPAC_74181 [Pristionchus pacificus]|eukprot:PDM71872.1 hypothetical protein PRIPAC_38279 [Pristionchus pacificus]